MGDGTKEKPYTREDVLRLIKKNGGTAEGLDLTGKWFEKGIDLRKLNLNGIILNGASLEKARLKGTKLRNAHLEGAWLLKANLERASLIDAHLEKADLSQAHLEEASLDRAHLEEAELWGAHLERAYLWGVNFEGSYLRGAYLAGAILRLAKLSSNTELANVNWGDYIVGEERLGNFKVATDTYRQLKAWHASVGMHDIAGKFFFREMTARRNDYWWGNISLPTVEIHQTVQLKKFPKALFPHKPFHWAWSALLNLLCGYGEKPERVVISAAVIVFGLAAAYSLWGSFSSSSFGDTLYYSVASFTALGYGRWAPQPTGWAKGMGAAEAVLGVSMMALFLVTFTRKMIR
jgi:hypothetical protein